MAEQQRSALKAIVTEIHFVLKTMAAKLQDAEAKKAVLLALGLNPAGAGQSPAIPAGSMNSIQQYIDKADDDADIEAFASVVNDIISVSDAIDSFVQLVTNDDPEIATEFFDMVLHLYLMDAMRLRAGAGQAKTFYSICKILSFYEELATPSGGLFGFTKSIAGFIKKIVTGFDIDTEEEAAATIDTVFLSLAVASFASSFVRDNLKIQHGFDVSPGSASPVADVISKRTITLSLQLKTDTPDGSEYSGTFFISVALKPEPHQGKGLKVLVGGSGKMESGFKGWKFTATVENAPVPKGKLKVERDGGEYKPFILGEIKGNYLQIGQPGIEVTATPVDNDLDIKISTKNSAFALKKGDGFITSFLPEKGIFGNFDLEIGYSLNKGLYVSGGSGLSVFIPLHISIFDVLVLNSFFLKLSGNEAKDGGSLETSIGFTTKFLAFTASVERIGLIHNFSIPAEGNLSDLKYSIGFKPPNGIGLAFDGGILKGGGFLYFDHDKGEYFGGLELAFVGYFTLKAIGVITTKMPDGTEGFSMLLILTLEVPIPLSFGFLLAGVGGLIGVNRSVKIDLLREGIKTNSVKSILFPEDIVANMSRIISDMRQLFPPQRDDYVGMPMGKISWGTSSLISLEFGILFGSDLSGFAILGVLKVVMPEEKSGLIRIQVNFLGVIDFKNKYISFDASLYDSRILIYTLEGDMAFRLSWGDDPMFIMTVGGFHPAFKEAPGDLQNMKRITISLLSGDNPRISLQSYYAITSNTVQFGAKAELYAAACGFNIYGFIGFDVLFQFDPFKFIAAFSAGLALRRGSSVIMGISVSGQLAGPKPMDAKGEASFSILFFDVTIDFHETWGGNAEAIEKQEEDIIARLKEDINSDQNWKAEIPPNNSLHVTIKKLEQEPGKLVVHPFGILAFSERSVPLEVNINKFGERKPKNDITRFEIKPTDDGIASDPLNEQFAPASFFNLNDSEKLARPSFERMKSGFAITGSSITKVPAMVTKSVDYELTYLRKKHGLLIFAGIYKYAKALFKTNLKTSAVANSSLSFGGKKVSYNAPETLHLQPQGFAIANTSDMKMYNATSSTGSYTEAAQMMIEMVTKDPSLKGKIQIVSQHELN